jgi:hypothetical protein
MTPSNQDYVPHLVYTYPETPSEGKPGVDMLNDPF